MYSLFIDTHSDLMVIALYKNGTLINIKKIESNQSHSNNLIPTIKDILDGYKIKSNDIKEIMVNNGPGSFTGVRIGVTVAKTFAYALNLPIKTVSSLQIKAISSSKEDKLVVESDKNGYFVGLFKNNELQNKMFYLNNLEFKEYIKNKNYEGIIIDKIEIDYEKLYKFIETIESLNYHEVKPLYVKQIEVLND